MPLTEKELKIYNEISQWEKELFQKEANEFDNNFDRYFEKTFSLLPEEVQQQWLSTLDNWLFHLNAIIQGSQLQMDAKERILSTSRVFHPEIINIEDLQKLSIEQLQYIAKQQISRHRLYSFIQGGLAGTGQAILLSSDLPAMAVINLRVVQLIATSYGFDVNTPFEMMTSLKVFHSAILPSKHKKRAWEELFSTIDHTGNTYFYDGNELVSELATLEQTVKQLFKAMFIRLLKGKSLKHIPFISIGIGAGSNYLLTKNVTDFAQKYYQMRYLLAKNNA